MSRGSSTNGASRDLGITVDEPADFPKVLWHRCPLASRGRVDRAFQAGWTEAADCAVRPICVAFLAGPSVPGRTVAIQEGNQIGPNLLNIRCVTMKYTLSGPYGGSPSPYRVRPSRNTLPFGSRPGHSGAGGGRSGHPPSGGLCLLGVPGDRTGASNHIEGDRTSMKRNPVA